MLNVPQTTHVTTLYLVLWTNIPLQVCLRVFMHIHVYVKHCFMSQFSLSCPQNNSEVYRHTYFNIYVRSCHCYNLLLFLPSRLFFLREKGSWRRDYIYLWLQSVRHRVGRTKNELITGKSFAFWLDTK